MKLRKITSLTMLLSFLLLIVTAIVLYVVPEGRVAYWSNWRFMGLSKTLWGDIHINLGVLFLLAGLLHIYYNWPPILAYMKNKARQLKVFTPEFNAALILTVVFIAGTLAHIPPMSTILDFSASFKESGAEKYGEPPYGHAELSSLKMFAKRTGLDLPEIKAQLEKARIVFTDDSQTLLDIAKANQCTPKDVYEAMQPEKSGADGEIQDFPDEPFPGFGKMGLADLCTRYSLNQEQLMAGLAEKQIQARAGQTIRDIAQANHMEPQQLFEIVHGVVAALKKD